MYLAVPLQKVQKEPRKGNRATTSVSESEPMTQLDSPEPKDKNTNRPVMAEIGATATVSPARKHRKRASKRDTKKEYYDAFRTNKSGFFGVETTIPGEGQNSPVNDTSFTIPATRGSGLQESNAKEAGVASLAKSDDIIRTPAIQRKRVLDIEMVEAESSRILRDYVNRKMANIKKIKISKAKEEAISAKTEAQVPMIVQKEALRQEILNARTVPAFTVRVPHTNTGLDSDAASPIRKRKKPFHPTRGAEEPVEPTPFPPGRKKVKLASPSQKCGMTEAVVRDLIDRNPNNPSLIKRLKRILPVDSENRPGRFIYMVGSPKPTGSDSPGTEKGNPSGDPKAGGKRPLAPRTSDDAAGGALAREDMFVMSQPYNLLEHVRNANPSSGGDVRGRMLDDRFLVPKTNFKNGFLVHKGLEKYFNHSTGSRLSLSQHFPQGFTQPQPSDKTLAHIALQIHYAAQQAGVADTIGGWAVMSVVFSCGGFKIAGVGIVLPDVKLASRIDFRGWPFLVEGAEVTGEITVETSRTGNKGTDENKQHNEKDQRILDAAEALTKLYQHHEESDTDTEPFMETKIVKVSENFKDNVFTHVDYHQNEAWPYNHTPQLRLSSLQHLESTIMRADHLTISFAIYDTAINPGEIVHTNSSMGRVCARRVYTSLKSNTMPRVVTREYCAETLDGSAFCRVEDKGSRVWRGDGSLRECGRILATVAGTGAALVNAGLICPLRAGA
ncbi:hypothetical protein DFP73DRAFT_284396 [Morchella snyderi]|nr:hypothetical protein DFP73DRAFT_284396 [Morchella snyderi]